ncbi:hypothetical protein GCM10010211_10130 [Streptomyces albospinus]|uniref:Uncharacterized protein n=1 Tax=Streptomyces albospinus TaxID=285515 RepID=A0ABQ2UPT3_9ACTN|nr:hypothetical protein [Streptomyces albospinus]GGU47946.1 hypothetical protein GCM10010211_10130 [Streptomyces albospinus]
MTAATTDAPEDSAGEELLQHPPAEVRYADELAALRAGDDDPRPPGRQLTLRAACRFIAVGAARVRATSSLAATGARPAGPGQKPSGVFCGAVRMDCRPTCG